MPPAPMSTHVRELTTLPTGTGVATPRHSVPRVPNKPATPKRGVRIPDDLWEAVKRVAADRGETVTDVIIRALKRYVLEHPSGNGGA